MQTFLPYHDCIKSAKVLDNLRLGKQRVETLQILNALTNRYYGWQNHPAVKMWRGNEAALQFYGIAICNEWIERGRQDNCIEQIKRFKFDGSIFLPDKFDDDFHMSHQSQLYHKFPSYYVQFFGEQPKREYVWPL